MAITTAGALTAGAITSSVVGAGMSFNQANEASREMRNAEKAAREALSSAREETEKNFYEELALANEAYELEGDLLMSSASAAINAASESERGVAGAAGRIFQQTQRGARDMSMRKAREVRELQRLAAAEDANLSRRRQSIEEEVAKGASIAEREMENLRDQAIGRGVGSAFDAVMTGVGEIGLYGKKSEGNSSERPYLDTDLASGVSFDMPLEEGVEAIMPNGSLNPNIGMNFDPTLPVEGAEILADLSPEEIDRLTKLAKYIRF